jgi:CheY-like chemotaxis protein
MNLRVLIVEDNPAQLDHLALLISNLDKAQKAEVGIDKVEVTKASNAVEAQQLLQAAARGAMPYDLLLLDLALPKDQGGGEIPERGLDLLRIAREQNAAREIIIVSAFLGFEQYLASSYRGGATDFISKPYRKEELQRRFLNTGRLLREQYLSKRQELLDARERTLSVYSWKSLAYQFGSYFSTFIQKVVYESEALGSELSSRFGLDITTDADDTIVQHLRGIDEAVRGVRDKWAELQSGDDDDDADLIVECELKRLAEELPPCVTVKFAEPLDGTTRVLSFQQSVEIILKEVLVGGLSEAGDNARPWTATVAVEVEGGMAKVIFEDSYPHIPDEAVVAINRGENIKPRQEWARAWGLSIAQHIALRGGGRLIIEPRKQGDGNRITYFIPLVQHA